ncbi:MAG: PadR family transcriptional regulator [Vicinamibacteria bacterium]
MIPTLSPKEALILDLLLGTDGRFGLELVEASNGTLKRGTVYVMLDRMQDKGLVESRPEVLPEGSGRTPRPRYRATGHGARVRKAWLAAEREWMVSVPPIPEPA